MTSVVHDIRYAVRSLLKQPAYSLTVVGMLTLGIAGNTTIFSVFNGLFLRPLPFATPDRLVNLDETAPQWDLEYVSINFQDFSFWRDNNTTFSSMAVFRRAISNLSGIGDAERLSGAQVSHELGTVLGITPILGRHFTADEDIPDGPKVVQLGYGLWQERFGADPNILGRAITLDREPYTVIGVLPPEASFIEESKYWIPLQTTATIRTGSWWLNGIGRLRPEVTIEQAREDLTRIHKNAIDERSVNEVTSPIVLPILERLLGAYRLGTTAMLGAVGLVLLIACANIAGLILARSLARRQEISIRIALGASRWRVAQQLLTESFVLAIVGASLGVALGLSVSSALRAITADALPAWVTFTLDVRVLGFTVFLTLAAALLFGLAPALSASRSQSGSVGGSAATRIIGGRAKHAALNILITSEVALSMVLLVAAGLSLRDFRALEKTDPGFLPENVLSYRVSLPPSAYDAPARAAFFDNHLNTIRGLPGIVDAGAVTNPPLSFHNGSFFQVQDEPPRAEDAPRPVTLVRYATPGYLEAIGVTMLAGRTFREGDGRGEESSVVIVNETFARRYWPEGEALGQYIRSGDENPWITVIGVAQDVQHYGVDTEMRQGVYFPYQVDEPSSMSMILRTARDPLSLVTAVRSILRSADANVPMATVTTMEEVLRESLWARRAASWLAAIFSAVALSLAVGGIYGVVSYTVSQRTREIGIRMALGARPAQELSRIMRRGVGVIALGIGLGSVGAFGAGKLLSRMLVHVSVTDPLVYGTVTLTLLVVTICANLIPAKRAATIHPADILRGD